MKSLYEDAGGKLTRTLSRLAPLFGTCVACLSSYRLLTTGAYARDHVKPGLIEAMPSLDSDLALRKALSLQTEPFFLGLASDVCLAFLLALVLHRLNKYLNYGLLIFLCAFLAADAEHIRYNAAHISWGLIPAGLSPTFIQAQVDENFLHNFFVLVAVCALAFLIFRINAMRTVIATAAIPVLLICFLTLRSEAFAYPIWMATSPLVNIAYSASLPEDTASPDSDSVLPRIAPTLTEPNLNILLIYLEGVSQDSIAKAGMKHLKALSDEAINFSSYYSRQIITANGLYASLTGFVPSFTARTRKWGQLSPDSEAARSSLPQLLANAGYHTAYLQSAPLKYMNKAKKIPILGYETVLGDAAWESREAISRNKWGVDDLSLFQNTLGYLDEMEHDSPWFVTVLTTGTHSPYNVPGIGRPSRLDALRYADMALGEIVAGLKVRGLLSRTLLVVTSDEGRETLDAPGILYNLPQNRLPLVLLHPKLGAATIDQPLMNTDLPSLIVESLSATSTTALHSFLPKHKDLIFGNYITKNIFWYDIEGMTLSACNLDFACKRMPNIESLSDLQETDSVSVFMPDFEEFILLHDGG